MQLRIFLIIAPFILAFAAMGCSPSVKDQFIGLNCTGTDSAGKRTLEFRENGQAYYHYTPSESATGAIRVENEPASWTVDDPDSNEVKIEFPGGSPVEARLNGSTLEVQGGVMLGSNFSLQCS